MPPSDNFIADQYSGQLINNLLRQADRAIARTENRTLCANCYLPLEAHSFHGHYCPAAWPETQRTIFSALLCEHIEPGIWGDGGGEECSLPTVVVDLESDQGRCEKHRRKL